MGFLLLTYSATGTGGAACSEFSLMNFFAKFVHKISIWSTERSKKKLRMTLTMKPSSYCFSMAFDCLEESCGLCLNALMSVRMPDTSL